MVYQNEAELNSEYLFVRPSVHINDLYNMFIGTLRILVLQMGKIGPLARPKITVNRKKWSAITKAQVKLQNFFLV